MAQGKRPRIQVGRDCRVGVAIGDDRASGAGRATLMPVYRAVTTWSVF